MKKAFVLILLLTSASITFAQTKKSAPTKKVAGSSYKSNFKFGYIFEDYILENYDEVKKLEKTLEEKKKIYQEDFNKLATDYQTKMIDYQTSIKSPDSLSTEKLNAKINSVKESKTKAEEFQRNSEKSIQEFTGMEVTKIKQNISLATNQVAAEKGFPFVLYRNKGESIFTGNRIVLYSNDKGANNLSNDVILKLGSKLPVKK